MGQHGMQVAIYARVSSDKQADECTIESQVADIKQRVGDDGMSLADELTFLDDGYSGELLKRPALERLRDQAATGAVDRIYVHSPDRLARKYAYQVLLVDEWLSLGVEIVFLNHGIGKTPEENLLLQVQGMIAEYEHAKILERSRRGKRHKAKSGSVSVLSAAPYGYRYITKAQGGGEARYEIVEEHARVVRQIYTWVGVERCSIGEVCRRLQNKGISSPKGKNHWDRTSVWGLLKNRAYKGQAHFGKTQQGPARPRLRNAKGAPPLSRRGRSSYDAAPEDHIAIPVPALVDDDLFDAVAEQLEENKRRSRRQKRGARYLLQGLTVCQQCGHAYYGKSLSRAAGKGKERDYAYYRCIGTDAYRFGGQRICCNKQCRTDLLDKAVWDDLSSLLIDPKRLRDEYERRQASAATSSDRDRQQLDKIVTKVKSGISRLIDAYQDGLLSKDEFQPRVTQAKQRLEKLEADAETLAKQQSDEQDLQEVLGQMQDFAARIQGDLHDADWNTRRDIIRALVKRVEIGEEGIRVHYKISPPPFDQGPASRAVLQHCWGSEDRALRRSLAVVRPVGAFDDPGIQPFEDQSNHTLVADAMFNELYQPVTIDVVKEPFDIGVQYPVHSLFVDSDRQGIQGLMLRAAGTEAVTDTEEVLLIDAFEDRSHCVLNDFVFQRGNAQRPFPAVRLFDIHPFRRFRSEGSAVKATMKIRNAVFQVRLIFLPTDSVDTPCGVLAKLVEARFERLGSDVMEQVGESEITATFRRLTHTDQPT